MKICQKDMETLNVISNDVINHYFVLCKTIPLYPLHTQNDYEKAIIILNNLLDAGGADENHPLARLVETLGIFIEQYENTYIPEIMKDTIFTVDDELAYQLALNEKDESISLEDLKKRYDAN